MSYCKECGNKLEDGVNFCPKCGCPTDSTLANDSDTIVDNGKNSAEAKQFKLKIEQLIDDSTV